MSQKLPSSGQDDIILRIDPGRQTGSGAQPGAEQVNQSDPGHGDAYDDDALDGKGGRVAVA